MTTGWYFGAATSRFRWQPPTSGAAAGCLVLTGRIIVAAGGRQPVRGRLRHARPLSGART